MEIVCDLEDPDGDLIMVSLHDVSAGDGDKLLRWFVSFNLRNLGIPRGFVFIPNSETKSKSSLVNELNGLLS